MEDRDRTTCEASFVETKSGEEGGAGVGCLRSVSVTSGCRIHNDQRAGRGYTTMTNTTQGHEITLGEEDISDVSLATFYAFDKENSGTLQGGMLQLARGGGGGGCRGGDGGCRACGGGFRHRRDVRRPSCQVAWSAAARRASWVKSRVPDSAARTCKEVARRREDCGGPCRVRTASKSRPRRLPAIPTRAANADIRA
jgi:hypothetical protein